MSSAWRCDSCEANNEAGATECRICHQVPGSATGAARQVADAFVQTRQTGPAPEYTESRHGQYRPPPMRPPMPIGGTPPRPPVAPLPRPVARPKHGNGGLVFGLIGVAAVAVVIIAAALSTHHQVAGGQAPSDPGVAAPSSESSAPAVPPLPSGPPCPDAAATYLADSGADSVLIVEYDSPRYTITLCEADDGQLYYDGQLKDSAPSDTTHISIPAEQSTSGYTASNNGYTYEIGSTEEQLVHGGHVIEEFPLTRTGP